MQNNRTMENTTKENPKAIIHIVSILLAIATVAFTIFITAILILFLEFAEIMSHAGYILVESLIVLIPITIACYFICRKNPYSIWYVVIIVNAGVLFIIGLGSHSGLLTNFWSPPAKIILLVISIALSTGLCIWGAKNGKRRMSIELD